jgi:hypothetical protein
MISRSYWIRVRRWAWLVAPLAALGCGTNAVAEPQATVEPVAEEDQADLGKSWVRLRRDEDHRALAMETAIIRYVPADAYVAGQAVEDYEQYVDLVGAVHIADQGYYDALNNRFRQYDAVLYELVAPSGTVVPRGTRASDRHLLGALQNAMTEWLEVEHQLEQIDYTQSNFVHADLSPDEFFESMDRKDESFLDMYFRILGASIAHQSEAAANGENPDIEMLVALVSEDRARRFKILLAKQFEGMESLMLALSGPDGSTLITERNIRALDVLEERRDDGDDRLAIFYGAGHLAEMDDQIRERFDMVPVSIEWLEAWDLRKDEDK